MKINIVFLFMVLLAIFCFLFPSVSFCEYYIYDFKFPSEILGIRSPKDVATDSSGNVYVADSDYKIIKYNSSGNVLLTFGTIGSSNGQFYNEVSIAINSSDNIYVADSNNNRIQKFSSGGVYQTKWGSYGSANGQFDQPSGVAIDSSGYVYVADSMNSRIQKFDSGGIYQTKWGSFGSGNGQFSRPSGVAIDSSGYVYVADSMNSRIQKFDSGGVYQTKWGSFGSGNGQFNYPNDIILDNSGYVYVVDMGNSRIQKFDSNGVYQTQWGSLGNGNGQFNNPFGIARSNSGNFYIADTGNNRIQKFNSSYVYQTQWGLEDGLADGQFRFPRGIAIDDSEYIYVADSSNCRIQKFDSSGTYQTKWGSSGNGNGQFGNPMGIATDQFGYVYVVDNTNNNVQKFDTNGMYQTKWGSNGSGNGQFSSPVDIAIDNSGYVYVVDMGNNRIQKFDSNGVYQTQWGSLGSGNGQFISPFGAAIDNLGYIYVADYGNNRIQKFSSSGVYQTQWGSFGTGNGQFDKPTGIAIGNSNNVYVVDSNNNRIQEFDSNGNFKAVWGTFGSGNGQFNFPFNLAINSSGEIYVVETYNHRVQAFKIGITLLEPLANVTSGNNINFSVEVSIPNITAVSLYYRKGGEASYQSSSLSMQSDAIWLITIPAGYNTMRGIAYYVDAVDNVGSHFYYGTVGIPKNIHVAGTIDVSSKTTPPASANIWNIVGPSVITSDKSIVNNIGSGFGTTWIAWRWNATLACWEVPTALGSNPVTSDPFDAGTSWFYALDGDGSYVAKSVGGVSMDVSKSFSVPLKIGWNLVCNPFEFSVAWSDAVVKIKYGAWEGTPTQAESAGYVDNRAIWYNPDKRAYVIRYSNESTPYAMTKTKGQWLYSSVDNAYIVFPPTEYTGSPSPPSKPETDSSLWKIQLILKSSKCNDIVEAIADNKKQVGLNDIKAPSLPISTSNISFIRDNNELSSDRQKESNEMIWTFEVNASEESSLNWKLLDIPDDYRLILADESGKQTDIRQINNLLINKVENGRYILKATRVSVPKATRLLANYPNPFNPDTWIPYELSEGSEVVIKIYTLEGNLVRILNLGRKEAGYYTTQSRSAHWDGKNEYGERVSSGIYFYSIKTDGYTSTRKMVITK